LAVRESTIGDTLLRVSECLVVPNEIPAEHFLFPYRTELLTPWQPLYVAGSNQALRSPVTTGLRTAISSQRVSRTAALTTPCSSLIPTPEPTPIQSSQSGAPIRSSSGSTTGSKTTSTSRTVHVHSEVPKWRAVKVFLGQYNRVEDYKYHSHSTCSQRGTKVARRQGLPRAIQQGRRLQVPLA